MQKLKEAHRNILGALKMKLLITESYNYSHSQTHRPVISKWSLVTHTHTYEHVVYKLHHIYIHRIYRCAIFFTLDFTVPTTYQLVHCIKNGLLEGGKFLFVC